MQAYCMKCRTKREMRAAKYHRYIISNKGNQGQDASSPVETGNAGLQRNSR